MSKNVKKLPKSPKEGQEYAIRTKAGRRITFLSTGVKGFGKWKITKNTKA